MSLSHTSGLTTEQMDKLKAEYMRIQLERAQLAQQQTAYNAHQAHVNAHQQAVHTYTTNNTGNLTLGGALTANSSSWWSQSPIPVEVQQEKLDEGAWDVPVSQLVDLWVVRYGSKWVNQSELDEFYHIAARRLRALNKLEMHFVNSTDVYRIVE